MCEDKMFNIQWFQQQHQPPWWNIKNIHTISIWLHSIQSENAALSNHMRAYTSIRHIYFYCVNVCVYIQQHIMDISAKKGGTRAITNCFFKRRSTCVSYAHKHFDIAFCIIKYMEYERDTDAWSDRHSSGSRKGEKTHRGEKITTTIIQCKYQRNSRFMLYLWINAQYITHESKIVSSLSSDFFFVETWKGYKVDKIKRFKNTLTFQHIK